MAVSRHHLAWVRSRREDLQAEFSRAAFQRFARAFGEKGALPSLPAAKRTDTMKALLAAVPKSRCVAVPLFKPGAPHPVVAAEGEAGLTLWFFTPLGDPLLTVSEQARRLVWKRFTPSSSGARRSPRAAST